MSGETNPTEAAMSPVAFAVPRGACDCHTHVFLDRARYPLAAGRAYSPPEASTAELLGLQRALGLDRVVIVQPSVYGTDNSATLDGMRELGPARARGVAVIDETTSAAELDAMAAAGMRGVRVNLDTAGETDPGRARRRLAEVGRQIAGRGWHVQIFTQLSVIAALADELAAFPAPLVLDHFGGARAALGPDQPGFATVLGLVRSGKAHVKLSGVYRASVTPPGYGDAAPLARALIAAGPERMLWGSDWPHPDATHRAGAALEETAPFLPVDDGAVLNLLHGWAEGDAALLRQILVDNPARLYGF